MTLACVTQYRDIGSDSTDSDLVSDLLWAPAVEVPGSRLDDEQLFQAVAECFPDQAVCIVRHWMLLDVIFTPDDAPQSWQPGLTQTVLYANYAVEVGVSGGLHSEVVSDYARRLEDCFFETDDKLYILAGRGFRRQASLVAVTALARLHGMA